MTTSRDSKAADTISNCIHANLESVKEELKKYFPVIHKKSLSSDELLDLRYAVKDRKYDAV
jgi:hypothetical protein